MKNHRLYRFLSKVSSRAWFAVLIALLFFGALFWAKGRDPFQRVWFNLKPTSGSNTKAIAVLPKMAVRPLPIVIYVTDAEGGLLSIGNDLRQMAELGLAAVGMESNQTNEFELVSQFVVLNHYLHRQKWADTNSIVWVSDSSALFVESVMLALQTNGVRVALFKLPEVARNLQLNRLAAFRMAGETCLIKLRGTNALKSYESLLLWHGKAKPLWLYWLPAFGWGFAWLFVKWHCSTASIPKDDRKLRPLEIALRWITGILAFLAIGQTALHLIPPQLAISPLNLEIARNHLVKTKEKPDFDFLAVNPVWSGKRLKTLLTHVELANYNRELVNWKLDDQLYREFVLSPEIDPAFDGAMNWRRPLWESFYPRIRKENSLEAAAEIVVRHLRERVTIAEGENLSVDIQNIWLRQITTAAGFERIYVAALRSAGIPARLTASGQAEFWNGAEWKPAPRPVKSTQEK